MVTVLIFMLARSYTEAQKSASLRAVQLRFDPFGPSDVTPLAQFLTASEWPYHHEPRVDESWVRARLESGYFFGDDAKSFLVRDDAERLLAFGRIFDLSDITPLVDVRVAAAARSRGVGTLALRGLTAWLFSEYPEAERLGGYTRHDNAPMRRVFDKCGFLQEAHHRRAWRVSGGTTVDCVGYAILRAEAESAG
jgi:RimJ/RimL family protein N-acetyltransferase